MTTVTIEQLMLQCNALPEDAALLEMYADTAEEQVEVDTNCTLAELQKEDGTYPARITQAVLFLVGHWYRNREAYSTMEMKEVPMTYRMLVSSLRNYKKTYRS